jgi:hypothetical protein
MNHVPPGQEPTEDVDDLYRRASASDPSRPGEAVRRSVLAHAARLAARRAAHQARWQPAVLGTLAAAALAVLVIAPQLLAPRAPPVAEPLPGVPAGDNTAREPATPPPAVAPQIAARPPMSVPSTNLPARTARARPKANAEITPLAAQSTAPAPSAGAEAADAGVVAGGVPARQLRVPGSPSAMTSLAAGSRIGTNPAAALRHAAEVGDLATLAALVGKQTDVDSRDGAGRTALMMATLHGQADAVTALLADGADPNAADADGTTPLQAAMAGNHPTIVAALRRYGAK